MVGKIKKKGLFRIAVYVTEEQITRMAAEAEKLKFRRVGIPLKKQKPHGFEHEWVANTDGISRYLKYGHEYYVKHEAERLEELAIIAKKKKELEEQERKMLRI